MARDGLLRLRRPPHGEGELRLVVPAGREEEVVPGGVREQLLREEAGVDLDLAALRADLPDHRRLVVAAEAREREVVGRQEVDLHRERADDVAGLGHGHHREALVAALEELDVEHRGAAGRRPHAFGAQPHVVGELDGQLADGVARDALVVARRRLAQADLDRVGVVSAGRLGSGLASDRGLGLAARRVVRGALTATGGEH